MLPRLRELNTHTGTSQLRGRSLACVLAGGEVVCVLDKGLSCLSAAGREMTDEGLLNLVVGGLSCWSADKVRSVLGGLAADVVC